MPVGAGASGAEIVANRGGSASSGMGAVVLPASPGFYHRPDSVEELVDQVVTKVLDRLGLRLDLIKRWKTSRSR